MNYKKLFTILIYVFVLFEIGNIIVLLDVLDVFEFERVINKSVEVLIPYIQIILFITGEVLVLVMLLRNNSEALYIKKTKILSSLFIISPVLIPIFSFVANFPTDFGINEIEPTTLLYITPILLLMIVFFVTYFIRLYFFNSLWSKTKKILFAIISSVIYIIVAAVVLVMYTLGMIDHNLS